MDITSKLSPYLTGLKISPKLATGSVAVAALLIGILNTTLSHTSAPKTVTVAIPSQKITLALPPKPTPKTEASAAEQITTPTSEVLPPAETPVAEATTPTGDITNNVLVPSGAAPSLLKRLVDAQKAKQILADAPIRELTVGTPDGLLPRIAADGRQPWFTYARPVPPLPPTAPKVAILMVDLGLSARLTRPALEQLPGQVSVAFSAFSPNLENQINFARTNGFNGGHEVILDVPAEPLGYPQEDPGPDALLTRLTAEQNLKRLRPFLAKAPGIIGIVNTTGGRFANDGDALSPVLQEMNLRGLAYVDVSHRRAGNTTPTITSLLAKQIGTTTADAETWVDDILSPSQIRNQLTTALETARSQGSALIVARPYPLTVGLLNEFIAALPEQGVALVPVSAVMKKHAE